REPEGRPEAAGVPVERRAEDRGVQEPHGIGADGEERRVAEVEEASVAHDDVEPQREEHVDHPVGDRVHRLKPERLVDEGVGEQRGDEGGRAHARARHIFSADRSPMRPWGRKTRTRIRIAKTSALVQRAEMYWSLHADRKPIMRPPSAAPAMLPMPPSTAAVKARRPAW